MNEAVIVGGRYYRGFLNMVRYLAVTVTIGLLAVNLSDRWSLTIASIAALIIVGTMPARNHHTLLDAGVLAFYISSWLSTYYAYDISVALSQLQLRTVFILMYVAYSCLNTELIYLIIASGVGITIHCVETMIIFVASYRAWIDLHFYHIVDYRSWVALTLHGESPGNHAAIYLIAMTLMFYGLLEPDRKPRVAIPICIIAVAAVTISVLLSFSRALYVCCVLCYMVPAWQLAKSIVSHKRLVTFISALAVIVVTVSVVYVKPLIGGIKDTILWTAQTSQQRSTSGRMSIQMNAIHLLPHISLLGAGVSNYALEVRRAGLTPRPPITAHAFNTAMEITVEQGYVGAAILVILLAAVWRNASRGSRTSHGNTVIMGCLALVVYSMSQTFIIADQETATILAVFCVLVARMKGNDAPQE